jgi:hypothetical protein
MTIRSFRRGRVAQLAAVVTAALFAAEVPATWAAPAASARPATALEVQSEPAGAAVYVDGQLKGATPVAVEGIVSGDHTVRVVKEGFLENSRTVAVPVSGRSLHVALTPTKTQPRASMAVADSGSGGGGGNAALWVILGVVVAGAIGAGVYFATKNDPPTVSGVTASPATALQGATAVSLSASASDPDNDSLTYSWNFGDGATGSGATTTHVFQTAGTFTVTVEVSDGKKSATGTATVTVRSLAGSWAGQYSTGPTWSINFAQSGNVLSGTYTQTGYPTAQVSGSVGSPLTAHWTVAIPGQPVITFNGSADSSINSMSGTASIPGLTVNFSMTRQ